MLVLGIESASDQCGCALASDGGVVAEARLALPRRHAEALAPQMRFVCEQASVTLGDVDVVAVDCGPGLYTGLRAGLATAKATAAALGVPVVPVGSLEALAFGARPRPGDTVLSVLDARRGEVFWAWYRCVDVPPASPAAARSDTTRLSGASDVDGIPAHRGASGSGATLGVGGGADDWSASGAHSAHAPAGGFTSGDASAPSVRPAGDPDLGTASVSGAASGAASGGGSFVGGLVSLTVPRVGPPAALAAEIARYSLAAASSVGDLGGASIAGAGSAGVASTGAASSSVGSPAGSPIAGAGSAGVAATGATLSPAAAPTHLALPAAELSGDILVVGDGALRYADALAISPRVVMAGPELRFPSPGAVALLGRERALAGGTIPPEQVEALYLRPPDARPQP